MVGLRPVLLPYIMLSLLRQNSVTSLAYSIVREGDALIEVTYFLVRTVTQVMGKVAYRRLRASFFLVWQICVTPRGFLKMYAAFLLVQATIMIGV